MNELAEIFTDSENNETLSILTEKLVENRRKILQHKQELNDLTAYETQLVDTWNKKMLESGLTSLKTKDGVNVISTKKVSYYIKPEEKLNFLKYLENIGDGGLIKRDVSFMTLQAYLKESNAEKQEQLKTFLKESENLSVMIRGL